jgi:hypothetical protein
MITKQAIRRGISISSDGLILNKEETIALSEKWTEKEENLFRKMLRQGGSFSIQGKKFRISVPEQIYNNKGEVEGIIYEEETNENS